MTSSSLRAGGFSFIASKLYSIKKRHNSRENMKDRSEFLFYFLKDLLNKGLKVSGGSDHPKGKIPYLRDWQTKKGNIIPDFFSSLWWINYSFKSRLRNLKSFWITKILETLGISKENLRNPKNSYKIYRTNFVIYDWHFLPISCSST